MKDKGKKCPKCGSTNTHDHWSCPDDHGLIINHNWRCHDCGWDDQQDERDKAKKRAAAEELYAALEDLMSAMDDVMNNAERVPDCIVYVAEEEMDEASAALKKARGEK